MKKNNFIKIAALSILLLSVSCNEDNDNKLENSTPKTELVQKSLSRSEQNTEEQEILNFFENYSQKTNPKGACKKFHVSVGVGIFTVDTDVWYCCTTLTMNCTVYPDAIFNKSGTNKETSSIKEFEILDSSIYTDENGNRFKIKNGIYKVADDSSFQLNLEEVK
jgi:hypothetical protein